MLMSRTADRERVETDLRDAYADLRPNHNFVSDLQARLATLGEPAPLDPTEHGALRRLLHPRTWRVVSHPPIWAAVAAVCVIIVLPMGLLIAQRTEHRGGNVPVTAPTSVAAAATAPAQSDQTVPAATPGPEQQGFVPNIGFVDLRTVRFLEAPITGRFTLRDVDAADPNWGWLPPGAAPVTFTIDVTITNVVALRERTAIALQVGCAPTAGNPCAAWVAQLKASPLGGQFTDDPTSPTILERLVGMVGFATDDGWTSGYWLDYDSPWPRTIERDLVLGTDALPPETLRATLSLYHMTAGGRDMDEPLSFDIHLLPATDPRVTSRWIAPRTPEHAAAVDGGVAVTVTHVVDLPDGRVVVAAEAGAAPDAGNPPARVATWTGIPLRATESMTLPLGLFRTDEPYGGVLVDDTARRHVPQANTHLMWSRHVTDASPGTVPTGNVALFSPVGPSKRLEYQADRVWLHTEFETDPIDLSGLAAPGDVLPLDMRIPVGVGEVHLTDVRLLPVPPLSSGYPEPAGASVAPHTWWVELSYEFAPGDGVRVNHIEATDLSPADDPSGWGAGWLGQTVGRTSGAPRTDTSMTFEVHTVDALPRVRAKMALDVEVNGTWRVSWSPEPGAPQATDNAARPATPEPGAAETADATVP
jgi:hypothetical protein